MSAGVNSEPEVYVLGARPTEALKDSCRSLQDFITFGDRYIVRGDAAVHIFRSNSACGQARRYVLHTQNSVPQVVQILTSSLPKVPLQLDWLSSTPQSVFLALPDCPEMHLLLALSSLPTHPRCLGQSYI